MEIISELFEEIIDEWEEITKATPTDTSRWSTMYEQVFKKPEDGTYWRLDWSRGSTEYQDVGVENICMFEVFPLSIQTISYLTKQEYDDYRKKNK